MKAYVSRESLITFLLTTPMFEDLDPMEIREMIHIAETEKYQPGETIFLEGSPGDAWYAIYSGEVDVSKNSDGGEQKIRTLGPRSCFGEIAILDGLPRSATIRAATESVVVRVPQDKFNELIESDHIAAYKLVKQMALTLVRQQRANTEILSNLLKSNEIGSVHEGIMGIVGDSSIRE